MTDLTPEEILAAIDRALETVSRRFAQDVSRADIEPERHSLEYKSTSVLRSIAEQEMSKISP